MMSFIAALLITPMSFIVGVIMYIASGGSEAGPFNNHYGFTRKTDLFPVFKNPNLYEKLYCYKTYFHFIWGIL
jgi:3-polyprenyl-4-hydroxybenzoate decarboxylase